MRDLLAALFETQNGEAPMFEATMNINVKLSDALVESARRCGNVENSSVAQQIEYWCQIGKITSENPDLPFSVIREVQIADREPSVGDYRFD